MGTGCQTSWIWLCPAESHQGVVVFGQGIRSGFMIISFCLRTLENGRTGASNLDGRRPVPTRKHKAIVIGCALAIAAAPFLTAQSPSYPSSGYPSGQQIAGPAVARVSLLNGEVSTQRGDSGDWIAAAVNAPLVAGDRVYAAAGSRAEIQFDSANFLRIGQETEIQLADLEPGQHQVQISKGIITYGILRNSSARVEIDTPLVAIRPTERGSYRVEVSENGQTQITVRGGRAEVSSRQGTEAIEGGHTLIVRADDPNSDVEVRDMPAPYPDQWDRWNDGRDAQLTRTASYQYVNPEVYGVEDLDAYGAWTQVPGYGPVWYPRVAATWAPYSYGRWCWIDGYGWTWVDYDPWGWAPFHYGRWFWRAGFGWGWWPGPVTVVSPWAPALVGFFGFGAASGFSVGFGFSNIGWVPLAPFEPLHPWWGHGFGSRTVITNINIVNVTNIRNVYRNAAVNGGVRAIAVQEFNQGRTFNHMAVNPAMISNAAQIRGMLPVVPSRNALQVSTHPVNRAAVPQSGAAQNRFFAVHQAPAVRSSFVQQQQQIAQALNGGRIQNRPAMRGNTGFSSGLPASPANTLRSPQGNNLVQGQSQFQAAPAAQVRGGATGKASGGWRSLGPAAWPSQSGLAQAPSGQANSPAAAPEAHNNGWRRFGEPRVASPPNSRPAAQDPGGNLRSPGNQHSFGPGSAPNNFAPAFRPSPGQYPAPQHSAPPVEPSRPAPQYSRPQASPWFGGGGGRQLQIQRPILAPRPGPAPSSGGSPRFGGGGSPHFSGGDRGGGGGQRGGNQHGGGGHSRR